VRLFICGFSGAGKSTLAKELASRLDIPAIDTDEVIAGDKPLAEQIEAWGWSEFRRKESELVMRLSGGLKGDSIVVSLGGGALNKETSKACRSKGCKLAWLNTPFEDCWTRIEDDKSRPLTAKGKLELQKLYDERVSLYESADISVSGDQAVDELFSYMASFS
tara:strand:+ start:91 stop:579 length:489 start_codon:yes stop_codon:yes gene_type:complete